MLFGPYKIAPNSIHKLSYEIVSPRDTPHLNNHENIGFLFKVVSPKDDFSQE